MIQKGYEGVVSEFVAEATKIPEVIAVFLYGSVAEGKAERRHSDVDFLLVVEGKKVKESVKHRVKEVEAKLASLATVHAELQSEKNIEGKDASLLETVFSRGELLFSRRLWVVSERQMGFQPYALYEYTTSGMSPSKVVSFLKALYGGVSTYRKGSGTVRKEYEGLAKALEIKKIGRSAILVPVKVQDAIEYLFREHGVKFRFERVWK